MPLRRPHRKRQQLLADVIGGQDFSLHVYDADGHSLGVLFNFVRYHYVQSNDNSSV